MPLPQNLAQMCSSTSVRLLSTVTAETVWSLSWGGAHGVQAPILASSGIDSSVKLWVPQLSRRMKRAV